MKELNNATGVDTSNITAKRDFIALKVEVDKLDINKLVNVPTSADNLKRKEDDLDVDKLKPVSIDLKKLRDIVSKEIVKSTQFNALNMTVNLEKKLPDETS